MGVDRAFGEVSSCDVSAVGVVWLRIGCWAGVGRSTLGTVLGTVTCLASSHVWSNHVLETITRAAKSSCRFDDVVGLITW